MGAYEFSNRVKANGQTLREAFSRLRQNAAWEHGHGGYTGTIAEKHDVVLRRSNPFASLEEATDFIYGPIDENGDRDWRNGDLEENGKWGPAFAVKYYGKDDILVYWFYGYASS